MEFHAKKKNERLKAMFEKRRRGSKETQEFWPRNDLDFGLKRLRKDCKG